MTLLLLLSSSRASRCTWAAERRFAAAVVDIDKMGRPKLGSSFFYTPGEKPPIQIQSGITVTLSALDSSVENSLPLRQTEVLGEVSTENTRLSSSDEPWFLKQIVVESLSFVRLFSDPMDYSLPGSSVHGISQARTLEWVAISFSRGSFPPRDQTHVSCVDRWVLYQQATGNIP